MNFIGREKEMARLERLILERKGRGFAASRGGRRYADDVGEFLVAVGS